VTSGPLDQSCYFIVASLIYIH